MNETNATISKASSLRPCYSCCHPNAKGTGCTVRFELHPAHGTIEGSVFVTFAAQKTIGSYDGGHKILPTFDWANRVTVRLTVNEVAEMLEVFRGYKEVLADGNGLFHRTAKANTIITLEHRTEPTSGYIFGVSRRATDGDTKRMRLLLAMNEAIVLSEALAGGLLYMAFGIPKVVERTPAAETVQAEAVRNLKDVA